MNNIKRLRYIYLTLLLFISTVIYLTVVAALPDSPIHTSSLARMNLVSVIPEGWAFFTRDSREENFYVYEKNKKNEWQLVNIPGASPSFLFGLDRSGRAFSAELSMLLEQLPGPGNWINSEVALKHFLSVDTFAIKKVINHSSLQRCKGELIIQKVPPVPWAWAKFKNVVMPYKIIKIYVEEGK